MKNQLPIVECEPCQILMKPSLNLVCQTANLLPNAITYMKKGMG